MLNNLRISYVTPSHDLNVGKYVSTDGNGGEIYDGYTAKNCLQKANSNKNQYQSSLHVSQAGTVRQIYGSVSDAPWHLNDIPVMTGAWSVNDMIFVDRQCANTNIGDSGPGQFTMSTVQAADLILNLHQDMNDNHSVAQQFVNQDVSVSVDAGDCIVHRRTANSNGAVDMESQLMLLIESTSGASQALAAPVTSGFIGLSTSITAPSTAPVSVPATQGITYGVVSDGTPISCDLLNPTAIKSLSAETIQWLASTQPSGIDLHEQYVIARQQGYNGAFGHGEHLAWLAQDSSRATAFNNAVQVAAQAPMLPEWATRAAHNADRRAAGYQGLFLCGGDICFQAGQCDSLGRQL